MVSPTFRQVFRRGGRKGTRKARRSRPGGLGSLVLALALFAGFALYLRPPGRLVEGRAYAVDGDSLRLNGADIRLAGIDAPELHQTCRKGGRPYACGQIARGRMVELVARPVRCRIAGRDRYGRSLARCTADDEDIAAILVRQGLAVAYGEYHMEEASARDRAAGLWAGEFERPDAWRRSRRSAVMP